MATSAESMYLGEFCSLRPALSLIKNASTTEVSFVFKPPPFEDAPFPPCSIVSSRSKLKHSWTRTALVTPSCPSSSGRGTAKAKVKAATFVRKPKEDRARRAQSRKFERFDRIRRTAAVSTGLARNANLDHGIA